MREFSRQAGRLARYDHLLSPCSSCRLHTLPPTQDMPIAKILAAVHAPCSDLCTKTSIIHSADHRYVSAHPARPFLTCTPSVLIAMDSDCPTKYSKAHLGGAHSPDAASGLGTGDPMEVV